MTHPDGLYAAYVELTEIDPTIDRHAAADRLRVTRKTLEKAIYRAEERAVASTEPDDRAALLIHAGEAFQHRGWDDVAERCYRRAEQIKQGATT